MACHVVSSFGRPRQSGSCEGGTLLEVTERERVLYLRVRETVALGEPSARFAEDLIEACAEVGERDEPLTAVALVSHGTVFCVAPPRSAVDCDAAAGVWGKATAALARLEPPTIAAISGDALGPAWELALACDLRVCVPEARLGSPEVRWGRIPAAGGTQRLARAVGVSRALRMLLLRDEISGAAAFDLGVVHRLAGADGLEPALEELLRPLRMAAPLALACAKEAVQQGSDLPLAYGLRLEADLSVLLQTTSDRAEGIAAFKERRPPRFKGR